MMHGDNSTVLFCDDALGEGGDYCVGVISSSPDLGDAGYNYACIRATYGIQNTSVITLDNDIFGEGYQGLFGVTELESNNGSIYCSGQESCQNISTISASNGDIYCGGFSSCKDSKINGAINVYCNGRDSCTNVQMTNVQNIYFTAYWAVYSSTFVICTFVYNGKSNIGLRLF